MDSLNATSNRNGVAHLVLQFQGFERLDPEDVGPSRGCKCQGRSIAVLPTPFNILTLTLATRYMP